MLNQMKNNLRKKCSKKWKKWSLRDTVHGLVPITEWLPRYKLKEDLPGDIAAGLTLGIMNIPQGLAFAMLASLPPITGLYVACIPVFAYVVFGTSKHLSVGTFAVISIMVANVIERKVSGQHDSETNANSSMSTTPQPNEKSGSWSAEDNEKIILSVTLCLIVGIIQTAMGFLRLGFITILLSDPLINGFTTGTAFWVFTSQIKHVIAIYPKRFSGPFAFVKTYIAIFKNITDINFASVIIGILCILILFGIKHINQKYKHKIKFPIPAELIVVALAAGISYGANMKQKFHIRIVESVPLGLPPLSVPSSDLISDLFVDGFVISVVAFVINISLAKLFSQKNGYPMDADQELIAYGVQNIVSCFFSCFVSAAALGRCLIQEDLGKTQITSVISSAIILLVLAVLAPLFEPLPNAVLAAIIIVAISKCFKNFMLVKKLWKENKTDAVTWVVTWAAVVLVGIDVGLGIGVMFGILALAYQISQGKLSVLGEVGGMVGVYDDIDHYEDTKELSGVVIVRFQSPLCFINVERFKEKLQKIVFSKRRTERTRKKAKCCYPNAFQKENVPCDNASGSNEYEVLNSTSVSSSESQQPTLVDHVHSVIIDCSSFIFIDSMAASLLSQIAVEYGRQNVKIYLVNCSYKVLEVLNGANVLERNKEISLFANIPEAVKHACEKGHKQMAHFTKSDDGTSQV